MTDDEYLQHRDHCLLMAEIAPTEQARTLFLRMARNSEVEGRLIKHSALRISESRAAIAKADGLLERALLGALQNKKVGAARSFCRYWLARAPDDRSFEASPRSRSRSSH